MATQQSIPQSVVETRDRPIRRTAGHHATKAESRAPLRGRFNNSKTPVSPARQNKLAPRARPHDSHCRNQERGGSEVEAHF